MLPTPDSFSWLDTDFIGELLAEHYPSIDPYRVGFTQLKKLVADLPGFHETPGHPVNERILETIQAAWIEEREDGGGGGGGEDEE